MGGPPTTPAPLNLAGAVAGLFAGAIALAVLLALGYLLYLRLWGSPGAGLYAALGLFGAAGLYAGWIAGLMVYSAVSSGPRQA